MACMALVMFGPKYIQTGHNVFNMYVFIVKYIKQELIISVNSSYFYKADFYF